MKHGKNGLLTLLAIWCFICEAVQYLQTRFILFVCDMAPLKNPKCASTNDDIKKNFNP